MAGFWTRRSSPLETQRRITLAFCQASPILDCTQSFFSHPKPIHGTVLWETGGNSTIIQASLRKRAWEPASALFLFEIFLPKILCAPEAFSFSANPILDCLPLPPATSSYSPSLFFPSDLIRSLSISLHWLVSTRALSHLLGFAAFLGLELN